MRLSLMSFLIVAAILTCLHPLRAQSEEMLIAEPLLKGLVEQDRSGPYQTLIDAAAQKANISISSKVTPINRALNVFTRGHMDCIITMYEPVTKVLGEGEVVTSYPLGIAKLYMFSRLGESAFTDESALMEHRVGGALGFEGYFVSYIEKGAVISLVSNENNLVAMLERGRIDIFLGFLPDQQSNLERLNYSPNHPLQVITDPLVCHNNEKGGTFVAVMSEALRDMKSDGMTRSILGDLYLEF